MEKREVLERHFPGIEQFRDIQEPAIDAILEGQRVLCLMPTGGGKSLIYQVAGLALEKCTLVISPLVALMSQQRDQLVRSGLGAVSFSGMDYRKQFQTLTAMLQGELPDFVFVSPERIANDGYLEYVLRARCEDIGLVVVDEAHCVSQWGEGFRPSYRNIPLALDRIFGDSWPRILCLTATLNEGQQDQIREDFRITRTIKAPALWRDNLDLEIVNLRDGKDETKDAELEGILEEHRGEKVLVFAHRKYGKKGTTRTLDAKYRDRYEGVAHFDSDMSDGEKASVLQGFTDGSIKIVFATSAFGMGVDIPDIRVVVNYLISETIEQYYQEVGRAGRDGKPAKGILLYTRQSRRGRTRLLGESLCTEGSLRSSWEELGPKRGNTMGCVNYEALSEEDRASFALFVDHDVLRVVAKGVLSLNCFEAVTDEGRRFLSDLYTYARKGMVSIIARKSGRNINTLSLDIWRHCSQGDIRMKSSPSKGIFYTFGRELTDDVIDEIVSDQEAKKRARILAFDRFADGIEAGRTAEELVREALRI